MHYACRQLLWSEKPKKKEPKTSVFQRVAHRLENYNGGGGGVQGSGRETRRQTAAATSATFRWQS